MKLDEIKLVGMSENRYRALLRLPEDLLERLPENLPIGRRNNLLPGLLGLVILKVKPKFHGSTPGNE